MGSWDCLPELGLPDVLAAAQPAAKMTLSKERIVTCPPLFECFNPAGRELGKELLEPRRTVVEGVNLLVFSNASLFGSRFVASTENLLYSDYLLTPQSLAQSIKGGGDVKAHEHKLVHESEFYTSAALDENPIKLEGLNLLITSSEPINFGAWLIRVLPKIHYLREAGVFDMGRCICFIDREWQKSLLSWMGVDPANVVHQTMHGSYQVEKLVIPTWPSRNKYLDDATLQFIAGARARTKPGPNAGKAIYVSRQGWNKQLDERLAKMPGALRMRPFDQEQELVDRLERLGVVIFSPEEHPFEEALSTFAHAKFVLGPQGAGLFNAIFCKPEIPVIEIAHLPYFMQGHANMFLSCGLKYMLIIGDDPELGQEGAHPVHRRLEIDIDAVMSFVERQLEACS